MRFPRQADEEERGVTSPFLLDSIRESLLLESDYPRGTVQTRINIPNDNQRFIGNRSKGVVYTKQAIVSLTFDLSFSLFPSDLRCLKILDVGCGYGQFLCEYAHRLVSDCRKRGLDRQETVLLVRENLRGIEINKETAIATEEGLVAIVASLYGEDDNNAWVHDVVKNADFLDWTPDLAKFDLIVGNLPYVKYGMIPKLPGGKSLEWIKENYKCFVGRADYSIPFIEKTLRLLSENGRAAIITSNRFTQAEYGTELRARLARQCEFVHEVDLSSVRAFDDSVSAYASIILLKLGEHRSSRYVRLLCTEERALTKLAATGVGHARGTEWYDVYSRGILPRNGSPWSPLPKAVTQILMRLLKNFPSFEEVGLHCAKGPATGANSVFIGRKDQFPLTDATKEESLLPLFRSSDTGKGKKKIPVFLLSVYESGTGKLMAFDDLPVDLRRYLEDHRPRLEKRFMVETGGREWWGMIDSFDPALTEEEKILVPDLRRGNAVVLDQGSLFPDHTVIHVTGASSSLKIAAAVLKSPISDLYRCWLSPVMRGGSPRASSKVISRMPFPEIQESKIKRLKTCSIDKIYNGYGLTEEDSAVICSALRRS